MTCHCTQGKPEVGDVFRAPGHDNDSGIYLAVATRKGDFDEQVMLVVWMSLDGVTTSWWTPNKYQHIVSKP